MTLVAFTVVGTPQPQGSTRSFVKNGKVVTTSANPRLRPWRDSVILAAREARGERVTFTGPVQVDVEFQVPRPKAHYGKQGVRPSAPLWSMTRPDLDKLVRAVLDALTQAGVVRDDSQVAIVYAQKMYGEPETRVAVMEAKP